MEKIIRKTLLYKTGVEYGDYCINHVLGCSHGCLYPCYAYLLKKRTGAVENYSDWTNPKIVGNAMELLEKEVARHKDKIKTVHLCFSTDPFMYGQDEIQDLSIDIMDYLNRAGISCTVLTKGIYPVTKINSSFFIYDPGKINSYGITLVSINEDFRKKYEPGAAGIEDRILSLKQLHDLGYKTWVSMEPYPTPNIIEQDLLPILKRVGFVDKIIFGKMNYNPVATSFVGSREFYKNKANIIIDFCNKNKIKCYVKEGTV